MAAIIRRYAAWACQRVALARARQDLPGRMAWIAPLSDNLGPSRALHSRLYFLKEISMLSLLGTLLVGLVVGLIARAVKPGDDKLGWIMTALLGVAGSFLASYVGAAMGWYAQGAAAGWFASVIGAVVLLVIYSLVKSKG